MRERRDLDKVSISVDKRLRIAPTSWPVISNKGLSTMLGLPPAIPTNSISMKTTRRICSIKPSGALG
jgi:hypothetical protein